VWITSYIDPRFLFVIAITTGAVWSGGIA